jgi:hypothetical protein
MDHTEANAVTQPTTHPRAREFETWAAEGLPQETISTVADAYRPMIGHYILPAVTDELIGIRQNLLKRAQPGAEVDPTTACKYVEQRLSGVFDPAQAAFRIARTVLAAYTAVQWGEIDNSLCRDFIGTQLEEKAREILPEMFREHAAGFCVGPAILTADEFLEGSSSTFHRAVRAVAGEIIDTLGLRTASLPQIEAYLGLTPNGAPPIP